MSIELESKKRVDALITAANSKTGGNASDLTSAVQLLVNGYGSSCEITEEWQRPSIYPDLSSLGVPEKGTVYFTYDCRDAKRGLIGEVAIGCSATSKLYRGYIEEGQFISVAEVPNENKAHYDTLPINEGDFVVYKLIATSSFGFIYTKNASISSQPCVEVYGSADGIIGSLIDCNSYTGLCPNIKSLVLHGNTIPSHWNFMGWYSFGFNKVEFMPIDDWILEDSVTGLGSAFKGYGALRHLNIPWVASQITTIANSFQNNYMLESVDVSFLDTSNVTNMSNAFNNCNSLKELDLSNFNTQKVTSFANMLMNCNQLLSLDFSNLDTSAVAAGSTISMLANCYSLTDLKVGKITTNFVFSNCNSLSHESLLNVIEALVETDTTLTLTIGATNIAKLTAEEIAVATEKGWTVV